MRETLATSYSVYDRAWRIPSGIQKPQTVICFSIKNKRANIKNIMDPTAAVLFGKTRQAVLASLFEHGTTGIYVRALERETGISAGALHQELQRLMQADLVQKTTDGNRVVYCMNPAHPVYEDLRGLIEKTVGLPAQLRQALVDVEARIQYAAIFGSTARGTSHSGSDIDLLLVGDLSASEVIERIGPLEERLQREIGFRLYTPQEFAERRGVDPFLLKVLARPTIPLMGKLGG